LRADRQSWLVPPTLGFWIPAGVVYRAHGSAARVYRIVVDPEACPVAWDGVVPVAVTSFLRETIIRLDDRTLSGDERARTAAVMFDALRPAGSAGVDMPMPQDDRLRRIAEALVSNPADDRTLADWGGVVGAGVRTLSRLFIAETGMTFAQWRLHARMRVALAGLTQGCPAGDVAHFIGYRNASSFAHAFRQVFGQTPRSVAATSAHAGGGR
jgi:AraC-like DNA-binding protein